MTGTAQPADVLDDTGALRAGDPGGMLERIASLPRQLRDGLAAAAGTAALPPPQGIRAVVMCGMGGSGVAGDVVRSVYGPTVEVPVVVVKGYTLPAFCDGDCLVVASSFSGDTEEVVSVYREALARGCRVVAVASNGELAALAEAHDAPLVPVPGEIGMPRAAVGFLSAAAIGVLHAVGLLPSAARDVEQAASLLEEFGPSLGPARPLDGNQAKAVAAWLGPRVPVVWGSEGLAEAAAGRWRTQFNENAKVPAFASVIPELDHNEVEGWTGLGDGPFAVVVLRHGREAAAIDRRVRATMAALEGPGLDIRQVSAPDAPALASLFALVAVGDYASAYAAILRGVDPTPVPVLTGLKERLARMDRR